MKDVNDKFNKAIMCVLLVILPITVFMSLLSQPIWTLFYGKSYYGPIVYKFFVYTALFGGFYTIIVNTLQGLNKYKLVIFTVLIGLICNAILDVPLIIMFSRLGFNPSYGAIMADLVGYTISIIISFIVLSYKYGFRFNSSLSKLPSVILSNICFIIVILLLKYIIPINLTSRFIQIPIIIVYAICAFGVYLFINYKNGNLKNVLGIDLKKVFKK